MFIVRKATKTWPYLINSSLIFRRQYQKSGITGNSYAILEFPFLLSVNYINILLAPFLYESTLGSFSLVTVWLWNFLMPKYCRKAPHKMLMKSTPGVSYINILMARFSYKNKLRIFSLITIQLGDFLEKGYCQKSTHKMLMKLTP